MVTLGNFIQTTTRENYFPTAVNNIFTGNNLLGRFMSKSRPWTGGRQLKKVTYLTKSTTGGSFSGFDTFTTTQEDTRQVLAVDPCQYYWNLTLSGIDVAVNKGKEAILNLIAQEFEEKTRALKDKMGDDLYSDGTGNDDKAILGLDYHIDDGTAVSTYEGLSRSTYTTLKSTESSNSGALTLANLGSDYAACQIGDDSPTLAATTPAVFAFIEALITITRNVDADRRFPLVPTGLTPGAGMSVNYGVNAIYFRGVPIITDEKCNSGKLYFMNENHLWLYRLDVDPMFAKGGTKNGFGWTGWKLSQNQDAAVGQMLWYGQLFGDSPRTMSVRDTITS